MDLSERISEVGDQFDGLQLPGRSRLGENPSQQSARNAELGAPSRTPPISMSANDTRSYAMYLSDAAQLAEQQSLRRQTLTCSARLRGTVAPISSSRKKI
jgi:hypothetical protein